RQRDAAAGAQPGGTRQSDAAAGAQPQGSGVPAAALNSQLDEAWLFAPALDAWLEGVKPRAIPALYPVDEAAADALYAFLSGGAYEDVFVAARGIDAARLARFTALPHVRGLMDFSDMEVWSRESLLDMLRVTNASGAKIAILPANLASRENVRFLQARLLTVWADAGRGRADLIGALAAGVNGIVTNDYEAAYGAIGFFRDDAPSMVRVPFIAAHRGMPSVYPENTLMGAQAAYDAGADVIENDIWLSADGELFILHDPTLRRLFGRGDLGEAERLTLAELQAVPFSFRGLEGVPYTNHTPANRSRYGAIREDASQRIPALREYYEAFQDTGIVHFVEIKSHDPAIVPALKALAEATGEAGQTVVISFNTDILEAMRREWPEVSLGALGTEGAGAAENRTFFEDYAAIARAQGAEEALRRLYGVLQPWNATYNPRFTFAYDLARAGRHRGLTVWPWTYNEPDAFAQAWLGGVYGLTTNFAWWMSGNATELRAEDAGGSGTLRLAVGEALPQPILLSQDGTQLDPAGAEAVVLEGEAVRDGQAAAPGEGVVIWRIRQSLTLNETVYGDYWLYSEPVRVKVE
ncbi:MAG TPA: glycerophosphodiester phosphodiesterase family protein, partial [Candidatus Limnocylindria bacterium]|nr:glycerophosphodiester phosphodiesterase family protein [Candidatus Limnocylindria bacterium]